MRMPDSLNLKPPKPAEDMGMPIEVEVMGLERDELPSHEQVEHMRFGLSASGPLSQAVLENNSNALLFALPTGITLASGMVLLYAKAGTWSPPDGWLECNGAAVNAQRYPELREVVGANVPNITQLSANLRYVVKT